jgi:hypothetical protein
MHIELLDVMIAREFKGKLYSIYELFHIVALVSLDVKKMTFYENAELQVRFLTWCRIAVLD